MVIEERFRGRIGDVSDSGSAQWATIHPNLVFANYAEESQGFCQKNTGADL